MDEYSPSVDALFFAALDKSSAAERAAYLEQVCADNAPLRRRVERLLEAHPLVADFLEAPAVDPSDDRVETERLGPGLLDDVLGDFRIIREIGRAGWVWSTRRSNVPCTVAWPSRSCRSPRCWIQTPAAVQNEAVAAASLKHPNIVSVYSVGCDRGVHFYAMEYVEGKSLEEVIAELRRESAPAMEVTGGPAPDQPTGAQPPLEAVSLVRRGDRGPTIPRKPLRCGFAAAGRRS